MNKNTIEINITWLYTANALIALLEDQINKLEDPQYVKTLIRNMALNADKYVDLYNVANEKGEK